MAQRILNEHRPARHNAIPNRPRMYQVTVRIHWETDGIEWINGLAKRWTADLVFVEFPDSRVYGGGVWVQATDVRRRAASGDA